MPNDIPYNFIMHQHSFPMSVPERLLMEAEISGAHWLMNITRVLIKESCSLEFKYHLVGLISLTYA